jgi:hypothetical protein
MHAVALDRRFDCIEDAAHIGSDDRRKLSRSPRSNDVLIEAQLGIVQRARAIVLAVSGQELLGGVRYRAGRICPWRASLCNGSENLGPSFTRLTILPWHGVTDKVGTLGYRMWGLWRKWLHYLRFYDMAGEVWREVMGLGDCSTSREPADPRQVQARPEGPTKSSARPTSTSLKRLAKR